MMLTSILFIIVIILLGALVVVNVVNRYDNYIESFIELNNNITVITTETEMIAMNSAGLNFFNFKTFKELYKKHKYLSKFFTEIESEDTKFVEGINWVTKINKMQNINVQMYNKKLKYTFAMQVSKIKENRYQVSFYNISRVMAEKDAITKVAQKDELTQIYNRSKFNLILSVSLRNAEIYNEPFTVILFDIDYFKKVNDQYGHNVGDHVLVQLTALIKSQLRSHDTFARWGGEEFIILSKPATENDSYLLAHRLRKYIESFPFDVIEKLTCSFGVSEFSKNDTAKSVIQRADNALYQAKKEGRNKVCK